MKSQPNLLLFFEQLITVIQDAVPSFSTLRELIRDLPKESVFIAGGSVRDVILNSNRPLKDLDIFLTRSAFEKIEKFFSIYGSLQRNQFGTYRWFGYADTDVYYDVIIIDQFYNGLWVCRNITDVLNQFDITANAIAFDLNDGTFYDPENGLLDIKTKLLRAVRFDYPELPVSSEIPLSRNTVLWFRYQHYRAVLDFELDLLTRQWIRENRYRVEELTLFSQYFFQPLVDYV